MLAVTPEMTPWQAALAVVVVGLLLSIGWQLGLLIYGAILGLLQRLARGGDG